MTNPMLAELDEVVRMMEAATEGPFVVDEYADVTANGEDVARIVNCDADAHLIARSVNFLRANHATLADMAKRLAAAEMDSKRLDFLQREVNTIGAYLLHNGRGSGKGFTGLGLKSMGRTLRRAIDQCLDAAAIDATQEGEG